MALEQKSLTDIVNFSRSTTGTYFASDGKIKSAAIDTVRLDYDPAGGAVRGMLIEEARTNLLLKSADIAASSTWQGAGDFTLETVVSAIDGGTAYKHTNGGSSSNRARWQDVGNFTGNPETISILIENVSASMTRLDMWDRTAAGYICNADLDWSDLSVSAKSGATARVMDLGTGPNGGQLVLLETTVTGPSGNGRQVVLFPTGTTVNTDAAIVHYVQFEVGGFASSYIPTTTTAVARAADLMTRTVGAEYAAAECSLAYSVTLRDPAAGGKAFEFSDGTGSNRFGVSFQVVMLSVVGGSVGAQIQDLVTLSVMTPYRFALGCAKDDWALYRDGVSSGSSVSGDLPQGITTLNIGSDYAGAYPLNGWLSEFVYYPVRLPDATLLEISQ